MGLFSSIGGILNDITGATSASQQQQKYNKRLMSIQNDYQKEFAQNAYQWGVDDAQKAGLNKIILAGGTPANAGGAGGGGGASAVSAGTNPIELLGGIVSAKKALAENENIEADKQLKEAETANLVAQNPYISKKAKAEIGALNAKSALDIEKTWSEQGSVKNLYGRGASSARTLARTKGNIKEALTEFLK